MKISVCTLFRNFNRYKNLVDDFVNAGFSRDSISGLDNAQSGYDCYSAIRKFLIESHSDFTIICHDDVALNNLKLTTLTTQIANTLKLYPKAAVFGVAGKDSRVIHGQGHFIGSNGEESWGIDLNRVIVSLDECFLVVRNSLGIMVGDGLEGFHFYGTELCIQARKLGFSSHVIDFPITHTSTGTLDAAFFRAKKNYEEYLNKNGIKSFIPTTCTLLYGGKNIFLKAFKDAFSIIMVQQSMHKNFPDANKTIFKNCSNRYHYILLKIFLAQIRLFFFLQQLSYKQQLPYKKNVSRILSDIKWWRKNWKTRFPLWSK
jgi:hypothetical protein